MSKPPSKSVLPADAESVLALASHSMFELLASVAMGMLVVDRQHRIVWISEGYRRFLPALGHTERDFVGRRVEDVVPSTLIPQCIDSGQSILLDLLTNQAGSFLVSRLVLRDPAGEVTGAVGLVLMDQPQTTLQPLLTKVNHLQRELDNARQQLAARRQPRYTITGFVGSGEAAMEVKRQARRVAQTSSTVLLLGETGTGKEVLAQGIHAASPRAARRFVGINIAAIPESLLEAEFFGVAPGAYTGAERKGRPGKFMLADGGTLFLDEIGDMPLQLQAKLLRVLQEHEVEAIGSNVVTPVDVRVIAATSRDLAGMVTAGTFRADLYYRLNVLPIRLPALRERLEDLEALVEALMDDIAQQNGLPPRTVTPEALDTLARHRWPGNIRELRNVLERAAMMHDEQVLGPAHFPLLAPAEPSPAPRPAQADDRRPLPSAVEALQLHAIQDALKASGGNKVAAARALGISRSTLYQKLSKSAGFGRESV